MTNANNEVVNVDRRTRKTKKAIKNAFIDLVSKNDISQITVKELADLADINRKTFYTYYNDVYAVSDAVADEMVENFISVINEYDIMKFMANPYELFKQITKFINEDIDYYGKFFSSNISDIILDKVKQSIRGILFPLLKEKVSVDSTLVDYTIEYSLGGMIAALRKWLNSDKKLTLEELSKQLSLIIANGLNPVYISSI